MNGLATTVVTATGVAATGAASAGADTASTLTGQILDPNTLAQAAPATLFAAGNVVSPHEQVNGVDTTHYRATGDVLQRWLSQEAGAAVTVSAGQADVWVANRDNYLKQYNLDAIVQDQDGRTVHRTVHLLVTDENKPVSVQTPAPDQVMTVPLFNGTPIPTAPATPAAVATAAAAQSSDAARAALATVPAPPQSNAVTKDSLPPALQTGLAAYAPGVASTRIYLSAAKMDALLAFYQAQMKQLGWSVVMSRAGQADQPALAMFSKNNINLMLVILPDPAEGKNVVLLQTEG
jgi:hypothetical protein